MTWLMTHDLVLFDVDGTLVRPKSGGEFRKTPDDWELLPGREQAIAELRQAGKTVALVTNQGGVAFGYYSAVDIRVEIARLASRLGLGEWRRGYPRWDGYYICYTHPKGTVEQYRVDDPRRKPQPGMILEALRHTGAMPGFTLMVGDRPEDEQAAQAAGVDFMWASEFFAPYERRLGRGGRA